MIGTKRPRTSTSSNSKVRSTTLLKGLEADASEYYQKRTLSDEHFLLQYEMNSTQRTTEMHNKLIVGAKMLATVEQPQSEFLLIL